MHMRRLCQRIAHSRTKEEKMSCGKNFSLPLLIALCFTFLWTTNGAGTGKSFGSCSGGNTKRFTFNSRQGVTSNCSSPNSNISCKSLKSAQYILNKYNKCVSIVIQDNTTLSIPIEISGHENITISGHENGMTAINCNNESAGFKISNTHNFLFSLLSLVNCSVQNDVNYQQGFTLAVAESCGVLISKVNIRNSSSTALIISNCTGNISVKNATFSNNGKHGKFCKHCFSSGGVSIQQGRVDGNASFYLIDNCTFSFNHAGNIKNDTRYPRNKEWRCGGGISIVMNRATSNSTVKIVDTNFTKNRAIRGGGLHAYFSRNASNNTIIIQGCQFNNNTADYSGGGVNFGFISSLHKNTLCINKTNFSYNYAKVGGGLTIYTNSVHRLSINISSSTWLGNEGYLSAAIDISPEDPAQSKNDVLPVVFFHDCDIINNIIGKKYRQDNNYSVHSPVTTRQPTTSYDNSGVVIITKFRANFSGTTKFVNNRYTALVLASSGVTFCNHSRVLFEKNLGLNGGGVAMYGFSTLTVSDYSVINFTNNYALRHGGAIVYRTIDQHNFITGRNCFIRRDTDTHKPLINSTTFIFHDNKAEITGAAIYSESFSGCFWECVPYRNHTYDKHHPYKDIFYCLGKVNFTGNKSFPQVVSSAKHFNFTKSPPLHFCAVPGDKVTLPFSVVDEFNQSINPLMSTANINGNITLQNVYSLTNITTPLGKPNTSSNFTLSVVGVQQINFRFTITLLPCPPGFYDINDNCSCASGTERYANVISCDQQKLQARIKPGMWVGYIPSDNSYSASCNPPVHKIPSNSLKLYFAPCNPPICKRITFLPKNGSKLDRLICDSNRTGILCGTCISGYSTHYNSRNFSCKLKNKCHLGPLFYFVSEIIPMFIFFVVVVTFDFSFTSGKSVGFVFFAQYLDKLTIRLDDVFSYMRMPYRIFYGVFNFEFFNIESLSFCPWEGSQILDIIALKYVTILIALGLVLALIALLRNNMCSSLCRLRSRVSAKTSVVHGLSAFLVICYAQCSRATFYILKVAKPVGYKGATTESYSYYGGMPYFGSQHLIYVIPAIAMLVTITILPPVVLLLYPLALQVLSLCGLSEHRVTLKILRLLRIHRLIPFIDCFQSCYKDKYRFFAGLYFFYRMIILVCFSIDSYGFAFHIYSEVLLVAFLGIHSLLQPYKEKAHNVIDTLILSNLAIINGIVIMSKRFSDNMEGGSGYKNPFLLVLSAVQLVFLYFPMMVVLIVGLTKLFKPVRRHLRASRFTDYVSVNDVLDYSRGSSTSTISTKEESSSYGAINA